MCYRVNRSVRQLSTTNPLDIYMIPFAEFSNAVTERDSECGYFCPMSECDFENDCETQSKAHTHPLTYYLVTNSHNPVT